MPEPADPRLRPRTIQRYGWIPDAPDHRDLRFAATDPSAPVPGAVDLRGSCPPVYDQGHLGSCTANAVAGAYEFDLRRQGLADFMPSRLFVYFNERVLEGTVGVDSGASLRDGMKMIATLGVCPEPEWPYLVERFRERPSDRCYREALAHRGLVYRRVAQDLGSLRACLAGGSPVAFGFSVYESFEGGAVHERGVVPLPAPGEQRLGGHAVLAVGYSDATERFVVRNSWGADWGEGGYCTMPYAYLADRGLAADFWSLEAVTA